MEKIIQSNSSIDIKALISFLYLVLFSLFARSQTVNKAEYFFDNHDNGLGHCTIVNLVHASDSTWQLPTITTSGLSVGYHKLYIRTLDGNGIWSQTTRLNIEIVGSLEVITDSIVAAEYFMDTEPNGGFGHGTAITVTPHDSSISKTFTIPASSFSASAIGYHTVYGRVKNSLGRWSEAFRYRFELLKNENTTSVTKVEYFFVDQKDKGFGKNNSQNFSPVFVDDSVSFNIPYPDLEFNHPGGDTLFIRVRDNINNRWSQTAKIIGLNIAPDPGPRIGETIEDASFIVYPNPATNNLNIKFKQDLQEPVEFTLVNIVGAVVQEQLIADSSTQIRINQPPGIYFVNLKSSKETFTRKIIIQ